MLREYNQGQDTKMTKGKRKKKEESLDLYLVEVFHVKILIEKVTVPPCNSLSIEPEAGEAVSSAVRGVGGLVPPAPSEMFVRYPRLYVFLVC